MGEPTELVGPSEQPGTEPVRDGKRGRIDVSDLVASLPERPAVVVSHHLDSLHSAGAGVPCNIWPLSGGTNSAEARASNVDGGAETSNDAGRDVRCRGRFCGAAHSDQAGDRNFNPVLFG